MIVSAMAWSLGTSAQEPTGEKPTIEDVGSPTNMGIVENSGLMTGKPSSGLSYDYVQRGRYDDGILNQRRDSLHLPPLSLDGHVMPIGMYPLSWGGWYWWDLHQGLNVNLGASVFAQFGKHARHGAGFTQNISAMYAAPLTDKLSIAVGGYMNNVYWAHDSYRDAGVSAVLGYQFDEHWEGYLYAQKSLMGSKFIPRPLYDMGELRDRIGAAVRYNFNPNFSVQVSFERNEYK